MNALTGSDRIKLLSGGLFNDISKDMDSLSKVRPVRVSSFQVMKKQSKRHSASYRLNKPYDHFYYQVLRSKVCLYKIRDNDAGYDILNDSYIKFEPFEQRIVGLGIAVDIPSGYVGNLHFTSSFSKNNKFVLTAGVIDSGYTGELKANVISLSSGVQVWKPNHRIIQIVLTKIFDRPPRCVDSGIFEKTDRGFR